MKPQKIPTHWVFTSRFSGMVMGWVGVLFFFLFFLGHLAFGGMLGEEVGTFRSWCSTISLNGTPQNSFRNYHFPIFQVLRIFRFPEFFWFPEFFRFSEYFKFLEFFWFLDIQKFQILRNFRIFSFPDLPLSLQFFLRPRNTLDAAGSL